MEFSSRKIERQDAIDILNWRYDPPYDLYNNEVCEESIKELLNFNYLAIFDENDWLSGFYCTGDSAQVPAGRVKGAYSSPALDVGIGMHPDLTGKGKGKVFFSFVLNEIRESHPNTLIRLTVAAFNKRAIKLYENMGFVKEREFSNESHLFFTMIMN